MRLIRLLQSLFIIGVLFIVISQVTSAEQKSMERIPTSTEEHNWKQSSVNYETLEVGEHKYNYWKNFMKHTRTCHISHRMKTVVYYCDIHNHTKSETILDEVIHSERHRKD
ncbi:hypothetical protein [Ornithinibacillus californiensis]|uniref:hypothetical protein n=1 Tax=Ornithinibacillus californiensis TaxID=161536 RepID=UPI0012EE50DC|nr:hypothetical protein [Ornithinibacillus californiensis]